MTRTLTVYINGRFCTQPTSGVQRYAHEIVRELDDMAGETPGRTRYVLLAPRIAPMLPLKHIEQRHVGRLRGHAWDQVSFAHAARRGVALSLGNVGPVLHRRHLLVIHDAAVQRHPEHFSPAYRFVHGTLGRVLARTASLATVSEFSRGELSAVLGVPARSILVAPNGWQHLKIEPDHSAVARLGLERQRYFLVLGNVTPNKNLAVVLRAMQRLEPGTARLVVVGRIDPRVFGSASAPQAGPDLLLAGRLDDAEVAGLMRQAKALIFPSIYEGFGIPPPEAFANDCPVLASTAGAVREVCGDAADYFDPHDDARLADLIRRVVADDGSWRADRLRKGPQRLERYCWRRSAEILADACARLAGEKP